MLHTFFILISRNNPKIKASKGARAGWFTGSNTSCRRHIASVHYKEYVIRCKRDGLKEQNAAVPRKIQEECAAAAAGVSKGKASQTTLDTVVEKVQTPTTFSREAILDGVAKHVVCSDQVSLLARFIALALFHTLYVGSSRGRYPNVHELPGHYATEDIS